MSGATATASTSSAVSTPTNPTAQPNQPAEPDMPYFTSTHEHTAICRYFLRGICRFGAMCRFSHELPGIGHDGEGNVNGNSDVVASGGSAAMPPKPTTNYRNWVNAPVFVPNGYNYATTSAAAAATDLMALDTVGGGGLGGVPSNKSWAEVVGNNALGVGVSNLAMRLGGSAFVNQMCPSRNPLDIHCVFGVHFELCELCDQYCLHPHDQAQRRKHNRECIQQHEQAMELSFAIARSKDKTCGICFDTIMEKTGREKRFGILPNCSHIFCLECIRKWRQAKQFEHKITRSCPECRVSSDFVCPSAFWVETKEDKDKLLDDYRSALAAKDCKYFRKGDGKCPFGNKCFYKHALPDGELVDVGCPKRARKLHDSTTEIIDLLDIYLWEFIDHRDHHWLEVLSSASDSDESDWSDV